jgi:hypothetical protein
MNGMSTSCYYKDLSEFLAKHNISPNSTEAKEVTHTRIGNKDLNVYGGKFHIPTEELSTFFRLYYEDIFVKNRKEHLTEKQVSGCGPLLVDFDFRYNYDVTTRQHSTEHIQDIIELYLDELKEIFKFEENISFPIFIMEKPHVNRDVSKQITKDGIHMIIGIQMDHSLQILLRKKVLAKIGTIWELPLTNDWENVLDEGISKGCVNWQIYGSQKPGYEAYRLTYYTMTSIDLTDNEFMTIPQNIKDFDLSKNLFQLSAQYRNHPKFEIHPKIMEEYNKLLLSVSKKSKPRIKPNLVLHDDGDNDEEICFDCAMKDEETTERKMAAYIFGD